MAHRQWNGQTWENYERNNFRLDCADDCAGCVDDAARRRVVVPPPVEPVAPAAREPEGAPS